MGIGSSPPPVGSILVLAPAVGATGEATAPAVAAAHATVVQAVAAAAIARGVVPDLTLVVIAPASLGSGTAVAPHLTPPGRFPEGGSYVNASDVLSAVSGADGGARGHSTDEASQNAHGAEGRTFVSTR